LSGRNGAPRGGFSRGRGGNFPGAAAIYCFAHNGTQIPQERRSFHRALNEDAASIQWIDFTPGQIKLAETVERTGDCWFGNVQLGGKTRTVCPPSFR
jgi:hypothetical protein